MSPEVRQAARPELASDVNAYGVHCLRALAPGTCVGAPGVGRLTPERGLPAGVTLLIRLDIPRPPTRGTFTAAHSHTWCALAYYR